MNTIKHRLAESVKTALAALMILGIFGGVFEVATVTAAGAAAPVFIAKGFAEYHDYMAATAAATDAPTVLNVGTLITGGPAVFKTKVDMTSLKILTTVPVAFGTVTTKLKTATQDYISLLPAKTVGTGGATIKFGICGPGKAAYTKTSPTCVTNTVKYSYGTGHFMDETVTVKGIKKVQIQETVPIADTAPTTVAQGTTFQVYMASPPVHAPATDTGYTVNYLSALTGVIQVPNTKTMSLVATSVHLIGGTKLTYKTTNITYCTAPIATKCTAKINTGNYKTVYPYMEIRLKAADHIKGGTNFDLPGALVTFKAIGKIGTKLSTYLTQFHINANVTLPIYGASTITATLYPSTKAKGATTPPPYKAPTPIYTTTIIAPKPTITSLAPATSLTTAQVPVTITGTGFETTFASTSIVTSVKVGTTVLKLTTTYTVTSNLVIKIKKMPKHAFGTVAVTVITQGGTAKKNFKFKPPAPTITAATTPVLSTGGTTVTITGTNFFTPVSAASDLTSVTVGGTVVVPTSVTATKIILKLPSHAVGADQIIVKVKSGGGTAKKTITVKSHVPTITSLLTTVGSAGTGPTTGNTTLTLTGSHFFTGFTHVKDVTALKVGTTLITTYTVVSTTVITFKDLAHKAGPVSVVVTNAAGSGTKKTAFTYVTPNPTITSLTPATGPVTGVATPVVVAGTGFITAVTSSVVVTTAFFTATKLTVHVTSATKLTIKAPAHAVGKVSLTLIMSNGTSKVTKPTAFTYTGSSLSITGISKPTGPTTAPTTVTITGTGFVTGATTITTLFVGGVKDPTFTVTNATTIHAKLPAHAKGKVTISVTNTAKATATDKTAFTYIPPKPTITSVTPTSGSATGGTTVTIKGTGFKTAFTTTLKVTSVTFGGTTATTVIVATATTLTAVTKAHAAGKVSVAVTTGGGSATDKTSFTFVKSSVTVTSVTPVTGTTTGGITVTIKGTNLTGASKVLFGTASGGIPVVINPTEITVTDPVHAVGPVAVTVTATAGTGSKPGAFTYTFPKPTISSVTPVTGTTTGGTSVTVKGTHLVTKATSKSLVTSVTFAGTVVAATQTGTSLTVSTPVHAIGLVPVTVTTSGGSATKVTAFTYKFPKPTITSVTPTTGTVTGGTSVTIKGTHFVTKATSKSLITTVTFGSKVTFTQTGTTLKISTPKHAAGHVSCVLKGTGGTVTKLTCFLYVKTSLSISSVTPKTGFTTGHYTVTLHGAGLKTVNSVTFGSQPGSVISASNTTVVVTAPVHAPGIVKITVKTPLGTAATATFTYVIPKPTVTSVTPKTGTTTGGIIVTVGGTHFITAGTGLSIVSSVTFSAAGATTINVTKTTTLTVTNPTHAVGPVPVTVTTTGGSATKVTAFTYKFPKPTITSVLPGTGSVTGGTSVTIKGTHFVTKATATTLVTSVTFAGAVISTTQTGTSLTLTTPKHTVGKVPVTVNTSGGSVTKATAFAYVKGGIGPLTVTPKTGFTTGHYTITVHGHGLKTVNAVTFGSVPGKVLSTTATSATLTVPVHTPGTVAITVSTPAKTSAKVTFTYVTPKPTITSVTPKTGTTTGGISVTVTGSHFFTAGTGASDVTGVTFSTTAATTVNASKTTTLSVTNPTHAVGAVSVTVTTSGGAATKTTAFTYTFPKPTITSVSPITGTTTGGTSVTVKGTHLVTKATSKSLVTSVTFAGTIVTTTQTGTSLTLSTPVHAVGAVPVTVTTSGGAATKTTAFTYTFPKPTITSVSPITGTTTGGTSVTVKGTHLVTKATSKSLVTSVTFAGTVVVATQTGTSLTLSTPVHAVGAVPVTVTTSGGAATKTTAFTYTFPKPLITSVTPKTGTTTGGTSVTVKGNHLVTKATSKSLVTSVTFAGTVVVATQTGTSLTLSTPVHAVGAVPVTVTTSGGAATKTTAFTYTFPKPTVVTVNPPVGLTTGGTSVKVTGTHLVTKATSKSLVTTLTFAGTKIVTFTQTGTALTLNIPVHAVGKVPVTITTSGGPATKATAFTYVKKKLVITSVAPATGFTTGGTTVTITGTGLATVKTVSFGSTVVKPTAATATKVTAISPIHAPGTVTIGVTTGTGTGGSANNAFTFKTPSPTVTGVIPITGTTAGGTKVTITGTHFITAGTGVSDVTAVTFASTPAKTLNVTKVTALSVLDPKHAPGKVGVTVTTTGGSATKATAFTYVSPKPTIVSISPATGSTAGGTKVTVVATNLITPGTSTTILTSVTFAGAKVAAAETGTTFSFTTAKAAPGKVSLTVTTTGGSATKATAFTYVSPKPTIVSTSPATGSTAGGTKVTVVATGLITPGTSATILTSVTFAGAKVTAIETGTTFSFTTAKSAPGKVSLTVTTSGGSVTKATAFTYVSPKPTIVSTSPATGSTAGGTKVTVVATGLITPGTSKSILTSVTFAGVKVTTSPAGTAFSFIAPKHAPGKVSLTVTTSGGSVTKATAFTYVSPKPTIVSVTPGTGSTAGGTKVTVVATNLITPGTSKSILTSVTFAGAKVTATETGTTLSFTTAKHAPGKVSLTVATTASSTTKATAFNFVSPVPTIVSVSPASETTAGGTKETVVATGLITPGTSKSILTGVTFAGTKVTAVETGTSLSFTTPKHAPGKVSVTVSTSGGSVTKATAFTYVSPSPTIVSSAPATGSTAGGTKITVVATGLITPGTSSSILSSVTFAGAKVTATETGTALSFTTPKGAPGKVALTVTTSGGTATKATAFTYVSPKPTIVSVTPATGPTAGGTKLTVVATGLITPGTSTSILTGVTFAGTKVTATETGTTLSFTTPKGAPGKVALTVTTSGGSATKGTAFTYVSPKPTITSVTPATGPTAGGTKVTVVGTGLITPGTSTSLLTAVTFAGAKVTATQTGTTLSFTTIKAAPGKVALSVTTSVGTATKATAFTYVSPVPTITSVTPSSGPVTGGTKVTVVATGLITPGTGKSILTGVTFAGAAITTVETATTLTLTTPKHATPGVVPLTVTTTGGTVTDKTAFTYQAAAPAPPTGVTLKAGIGSVTVGWVVPTNNGQPITTFLIIVTVNGTKGAPVTVKVVPPVSGTMGTHDSTTLSVPKGATISVTVAAVNSVAPGRYSPPSNHTKAGAKPNAPTGVLAVPQDHQVSLSWLCPTSNGSSITKFIVTPYLNGKAMKAITVRAGRSLTPKTFGSRDSLVVKGLTNEKRYTFSIKAVNGLGTSLASKSNIAIPVSGYWLVTGKGQIFHYGNAASYGTEFHKHLNKPIVGIAATATNKGYYLVASDGGIFAFGKARFHGSPAGLRLSNIKGMQVAPTGKGYWIYASNGVIFAYSKTKKHPAARDLGTLKGKTLTSPVVGMAITPTGLGYWLAQANGHVVAFGKATNFQHGSPIGGLRGKIIGIAGDHGAKGYWLLSSTGAVYRQGAAKYHGGLKGARKLAGILSTLNGNGYWISETSGKVAAFGTAETFKALPKGSRTVVVAMTAMN